MSARLPSFCVPPDFKVMHVPISTSIVPGWVGREGVSWPVFPLPSYKTRLSSYQTNGTFRRHRLRGLVSFCRAFISLETILMRSVGCYRMLSVCWDDGPSWRATPRILPTSTDTLSLLFPPWENRLYKNANITFVSWACLKTQKYDYILFQSTHHLAEWLKRCVTTLAELMTAYLSVFDTLDLVSTLW